MNKKNKMLFSVENPHTGVVLGVWKASGAREALDHSSRDAGYRDYAHACAVCNSDGDLVAVEVPDDHPAAIISSLGAGMKDEDQADTKGDNDE